MYIYKHAFMQETHTFHRPDLGPGPRPEPLPQPPLHLIIPKQQPHRTPTQPPQAHARAWCPAPGAGQCKVRFSCMEI